MAEICGKTIGQDGGPLTTCDGELKPEPSSVEGKRFIDMVCQKCGAPKGTPIEVKEHPNPTGEKMPLKI